MVKSDLLGVRSILETPILDDRKWSKVPSLPTDAVLLDLEDSVPPDRKLAAREKVVEFLGRTEFFAGRRPLPRVNSLSTPWGADDLRVLADAGADLIAYPKLSSAEELDDVCHLLRSSDAHPSLVVIVETAWAILHLDRIASTTGLAGLILGPSDLAVDVGWELFKDGEVFPDAYHYPKAKLAVAGAAYDVPAYDTVFVADLRNLEHVEAAAIHARRMGFSGMATFYPPHLPIVNAAFSPSDEQRAHAEWVVSTYEDALARGVAAVQVDGKTLIVQDYKRALRTLGRRA